MDEACRGDRLSQRMIEAAAAYAKSQQFDRVYIPSGLEGLYEKYGFTRIDELMNYDGEMDAVYTKEI